MRYPPPVEHKLYCATERFPGWSGSILENNLDVRCNYLSILESSPLECRSLWPACESHFDYTFRSDNILRFLLSYLIINLQPYIEMVAGRLGRKEMQFSLAFVGP